MIKNEPFDHKTIEKAQFEDKGRKNEPFKQKIDQYAHFCHKILIIEPNMEQNDRFRKEYDDIWAYRGFFREKGSNFAYLYAQIYAWTRRARELRNFTHHTISRVLKTA